MGGLACGLFFIAALAAGIFCGLVGAAQFVAGMQLADYAGGKNIIVAMCLFCMASVAFGAAAWLGESCS